VSSTATATLERNRQILKYFFGSFALLLVPVAVIVCLLAFDERPAWVRQGSWFFLSFWFVGSFLGLLCGVRAITLSDRKTDGFGILVVLLHTLSLFILGCCLCAGFSAG
jgi:hypothetical protein